MTDHRILDFPRPPEPIRFPTACARCDDGVITQTGFACCDLCIRAAERAVEKAGPGVVVTPAMIDAER